MITRRTLSKLLTLSLALTVPFLAACGKKDDASGNVSSSKPEVAQEISLSGAGATFPFPLYSKWMSEYNKLHPEVRINYQSIGSGGGIRQITSGTVDFGASDAPMSDADMKKASSPLVHIPTTIGAVVVAYNVPGLSQQLKLDPDVVADIFLGKLKKWNDPRLVASNPGVTLPAQDISVVTRSDGSGTTSVFTGYLAAVSPDFKSQVGEGKSVKWPAGLGAKGNEGVTGQVKTTPGAVGYIELAYASQNKLSFAAIKNQAGEYQSAEVPAVTAAAAGVEMPESLFVSLANPAGKGAYPISSYTYLLVYADAKDSVKGQALASFLWWAIHDGQKFAAELQYAPLPESVTKKLEARLKSLSFKGQPLLTNL